MLITVLGVRLAHDTELFSLHVKEEDALRTRQQIINNSKGELVENDFDIEELDLSFGWWDLIDRVLIPVLKRKRTLPEENDKPTSSPILPQPR